MGGSCGEGAIASHKTATKPLVGGLGSTLHLHCIKGSKPAIIWGSGATVTADWQCLGREPHKTFDVRAVRGYKTLDMLLRLNKLTPEAATRVPLGDPALLLPRMFPRCGRACGAPAEELCVVLHNNDYKEPRQREAIRREAVGAGVRGFTRAHIIGPQHVSGVLRVTRERHHIAHAANASHANATARTDPPSILVPYGTQNPTWMLEKILSCKLVLSSSLHGIVFAEAFGVPARWLELPGSKKSEKGFKYHDYYSGTRGRAVLGDESGGPGRFNASFGPAKSIQEGLRLGGAPPIPSTYDATPLYRTFPGKELSGCAAPRAAPGGVA